MNASGRVSESRRKALPLRRKGLVLLLVWLGSAAYVFPFRNRGWIPHDDGILGQSAERALNGAIPHLDFPEIYTGGLTYWHALAFRVFGVRLTSIRLALFLFFLAWVPAVFAIASRFASPLLAGAVTWLAVAWSVPNYFAGIPSWYNLFFATWGVLALLRHIETEDRRWLFLAGALAAISCLFKVIGAYFFAAALLFLLYREQQLSSGSDGRRSRRVTGFLLFQATGLALFLGVLFLTVRQELGEMEFVYFLAPAATICGFLLWREYTEGGGRFGHRLSALMGLVIPLAAGAFLPVLLVLTLLAVRGALPAFTGSLMAATSGHVRFVRMSLPPLSTFWPAVPYTLVLGAGTLREFRFAWLLRGLLAAALPAALWLSASTTEVYIVIWQSMRSLGVGAVVAACLRLADSHRLGFWSPRTRQMIFLLAAVVAITGLVQFPFAAPIYFFYFAPLIVLAIAALAGSESRPPRFLHAAVLVFYLLFAVLRTNRGYVYTVGSRFERYDPPAVLDLTRAGGLRVTAQDAETFDSLIPLVQEKGRGRPIYAGQDCPEVYFLSGLEEASPHDAGSPRDPMQRPEELFKSLEETGTRAAVLNRRPLWAGNISPEIAARFEQLFPHSRAIGRFVLRWKD